MEKDQNSIEGFVFLIEDNIIYIIDSFGNICLLHIKKDKTEVIMEKEYYLFTNLFYMHKDNNNNFIYDMTKSTTFNIMIGKTFFKKFVIIKFITLDQIKDKDIIIKLINNPTQKICYIKNKIQFISLIKDDDCQYFLQSFQLIINNKNTFFSFFIYKGQINSINVGLEENNLNKNKCYEIIFLSKEKKKFTMLSKCFKL